MDVRSADSSISVSPICYLRPKEMARDGEMTFRSKEHGMEKKRENLIPPIKFPIMGIFHPFFYLIIQY
jgi:hypothetical protein